MRFTKMQGLGNDFMVIDGVNQTVVLTPEILRQWGDRHTGVGFDQLLIVEPPSNPDVDFRYRIFNCDGTEVEQCGNGARCFARYVLDKRLTVKRQLRVETKGGIIELDIRNDGQIGVNMGPPRLQPAEIPFVADAQAVESAGAFAVTLECIPSELAAEVTAPLRIPTIGIGAGNACDGQVLVYQDMLGMFSDFVPKFVKQFAQVGEVMQGPVKDYINAVKEGTFPGPENTYAISDDVIEKLY